ncbi:MAG: MFS transporter, partial [Ktedonobacteraceae bacterium]|nr:MFS transporter [Ktedonobacteraceae bacterium]
MSAPGQTQPETRRIHKFMTSLPGGKVLRNRTFLAISLATFASYAGIGMVGPVRVLFAESRGASLAILTAMTTAYLVSNFLFQYPVGWLADHWGRKPIMVTGLLVQAALSATYLVMTDPIAFVVLRFLEGMAAAAILPSARALINDTIPPEQQGEAYGIFGAFFNGGFLLGPGIGGLLATTGYASAFIGAIVGRLIGLLLILTMIHTPKRSVVSTRKSTGIV